MKRYVALLVPFFICGLSTLVKSQITDYVFTPTSGTYTANSGSATSVVKINADDKESWGIAIGFPFIFNDSTQNYIKASSNGWLTFDTTKTPNSFISRTNVLSSAATLRPLIAPLWDDLDGSRPHQPYAGTDPSCTVGGSCRHNYGRGN